MSKPGDRVIAVLDSDDDEIRIFGEGVYTGDEVPPAGRGTMADWLNEAGVANPKIALDNGDVVWGCECWWGDVERFKTTIGNRVVKTVSIGDYLNQAPKE